MNHFDLNILSLSTCSPMKSYNQAWCVLQRITLPLLCCIILYTLCYHCTYVHVWCTTHLTLINAAFFYYYLCTKLKNICPRVLKSKTNLVFVLNEYFRVCRSSSRCIGSTVAFIWPIVMWDIIYLQNTWSDIFVCFHP